MRRLGVFSLCTAALLTWAAMLSSCSLDGGAKSAASTASRPVSYEATADLPPSVRADDITFVRGRHIWRAHADGSDPVQLTHGPQTDYAPTWSPTRKEIAFMFTYDFTLNETSTLCVVPSSGGRVRAWSFPTSLQSASYSPDGKRIALADLRSSGPDSPDEWTAERILLFDTSTHKVTVLKELRDELVAGMSVSWSPDGTKLLVGERTQDLGNQRTGVLTIATKELEWLDTPDAAESHWAPDGRSLVVSQSSPGSSAISIARLDGKIVAVLAQGAGDGTDTRVSGGSYSPDGTRIIYQQGSNLMGIRPDGGAKATIIASAASPAWSSR